MTQLARGTFEVSMTPQAMVDDDAGTRRGRSSLEKTFAGDLEGSGVGEMLTALTAVDGSAGYVAIERVVGTLHGRRGSFLLQHNGTMARGAQELTISVVADSGTGELAGLVGRMRIDIADGRHSYELEYTLPARD